ncbi:hypothetical protein [Paraburkholderia heleia]|uniref:hypothetical protein n=1 Tax=Paraburkholderia heleia TaxID=634127 RepID=UPI0012EEB9E0|nr:hypothetical protein [Paraburkholderia heleia]
MGSKANLRPLPATFRLLPVLLSSTPTLQRRATTAENIASGFGIGLAGTLSALGCLLAFQTNDSR